MVVVTRLFRELTKMSEDTKKLFRIITPVGPDERGAQLSLLLVDRLLIPTLEELQARAVIVDERKPNVIRVAPAPLYNRFEDCVAFVEAFELALLAAQEAVSVV